MDIGSLPQHPPEHPLQASGTEREEAHMPNTKRKKWERSIVMLGHQPLLPKLKMKTNMNPRARPTSKILEILEIKMKNNPQVESRRPMRDKEYTEGKILLNQTKTEKENSMNAIDPSVAELPMMNNKIDMGLMNIDKGELITRIIKIQPQVRSKKGLK